MEWKATNLKASGADYGFAHLIGGLATSVFAGGTLDLNNERGKELITMMSERHVTAALDHGGLPNTKITCRPGLFDEIIGGPYKRLNAIHCSMMDQL